MNAREDEVMSEMSETGSFDKPAFSSCHSNTHFSQSRMSDQLKILENILQLYKMHHYQRIYLGICAYCIDYYCTYLLHICDPDNMASVKREYGVAQMKIRGALPASITPQAALRQILQYLHDFDQHHPPNQKLTAEQIHSYVASCPYLIYGYGIFRMLSKTETGQHTMFADIVKGPWQGWKKYGFCNCLSSALMTALVAEHRGLGLIPMTRTEGGMDCKAERESFENLISLPAHHLDPRPAPSVARDWPDARLCMLVGRCGDLYNFLVMPIEAMISDATRGVTRSSVYRQLLEAFLMHIKDMLVRVFGHDWYD